MFRQVSCENCSCSTQNVQFYCFVLKRNWTVREISTRRAVWDSLRSGFRTTWYLWLGYLWVLHFCRWDCCPGICVFETHVNTRPLVHQWHLVVIGGTGNTPLQYGSLPCFVGFWAHVLQPSVQLIWCFVSSLDLWDLSCSKPGERCQSCQSKLVTAEGKPEPCGPTGWAMSTQHASNWFSSGRGAVQF